MCAAIDKTYCRKWKEYQEVVNWCKENEFTCPNGIVIKPINSIYYWNEDSFKEGKSLPIMNTSSSLDYFLIKYCPIKIIQDRMKEVYGAEYIKSVKNGTSEYDTFTYPEVGTKVKLIKGSIYHNKKPFSLYSEYCNKRITLVSIEVHYNGRYLWYSEDINKFLLHNELGNFTTFYADDLKCKSIKAMIRKIRKFKLPKGAIVYVNGRFVGETWKFLIK